MELALIETSRLDLIDELLQANRMSTELDDYRSKVRSGTDPWTLDDRGLLKYQE